MSSASWLLGIDIGATRIKVVLCDSEGPVRLQASALSGANPLSALAAVLEQIPDPGHNLPVRVGITGIGQGLLAGSRVYGVNEVVAVAFAVAREFPEARTIIDLGGQFCKWILVSASERGVVADFATNGLCAAGAGAFLEQQAGRLGLTIESLGERAASAPRGATIAGRCSVFAKSDMIHLQQNGTPVDEIAYGVCLALARTFAASVLQGRIVQPPVFLAGGGADNPGLARAFREVLKTTDLCIPAGSLFWSARGAAALAKKGDPLELGDFLERVKSRITGANISARGAALSSFECSVEASRNPRRKPFTGTAISKPGWEWMWDRSAPISPF